jgi:hypothetical protein
MIICLKLKNHCQFPQTNHVCDVVKYSMTRCGIFYHIIYKFHEGRKIYLEYSMIWHGLFCQIPSYSHSFVHLFTLSLASITLMDWDNPFSYEAHHTSNICFLQFVMLNRMWNHHLNLVWPPWPWVVQPWWSNLMIVDMMMLEIPWVFLVEPKGDHSFFNHVHLNPFQQLKHISQSVLGELQ